MRNSTFNDTVTTNDSPSIREPIAGDCFGTIPTLHKNKEITVPKMDKALVSEKRAWRLAKRAAKKRRLITDTDRQGGCHARIVHWPYWVGTIQTEKKRPLFGPRQITYYAISDAVIGGSTVARIVPAFETQSVPMDLLIPPEREIEAFEQELATVTKETIPKLFIFGPPAQQVESIQLIYCPFWEVSLRSNDEKVLSKVVYVNALNGSVRAC